MLDEQSRRRDRWDLLASFSSCVGDPACTPMPGALFEMLEIAAMERREDAYCALPRPVLDVPPLTPVANGSRMHIHWHRVVDTFGHVAHWLRFLGGGRRLRA